MSKLRPRWLQFSLKTLLIIMIFAAGYFAGMGTMLRRSEQQQRLTIEKQRRIAEQMRKLAIEHEQLASEAARKAKLQEQIAREQVRSAEETAQQAMLQALRSEAALKKLRSSRWGGDGGVRIEEQQ